MRIKNDFIAAAQTALLDAMPVGESREWSQLVAAVQASGLAVKDWRHVRCVLQLLLDAGRVTRSADIHTETYTRNN